ncbi:ribosomal protein L5 [Polychaeton citri CBS 116435]|uniref:Large ribosomal subunit protein uL5m n=1 Tax=Polychaeton citri CBS 116435 TaxID=1314669 RepID=A0A9P4Q8B1_9PEZI|nr:ribosomal protein L5 [Polychaeton citri CBS 116435]
MTLQEVSTGLWRRLASSASRTSRVANAQQQQRRHQSTAVSQELEDLEKSSFIAGEQPTTEPQFDPLSRSRGRKRRLPASRYQFRPPKYYRGPLHPHQPPPASDPSSRAFIPGPFSLPRLKQTYDDTIASDLMTLSYTHYPPGYTHAQKGDRLRSWDGESPYYKNRQLRGPRGGEVLKLLRKPITFRNVPELKRITVHSMASGVIDHGSSYLHTAGMVMQAITGVRAQAHAAKKSVASFGIRQGKYLSVTCELQGEAMYHFLSKVVDVVMPKLKDWKGVKGSSGDSSGNIAFGLTGEEVATFPEIEVNYDMYPPKMIPGCHIIVHTSATNDKDARMLLSSIGIPFYGKLIN